LVDRYSLLVVNGSPAIDYTLIVFKAQQRIFKTIHELPPGVTINHVNGQFEVCGTCADDFEKHFQTNPVASFREMDLFQERVRVASKSAKGVGKTE
jgi:hypothetical protein